jgi:TorA maturation chaperone TorD
MKENVLIRLRADLADAGLARDGGAAEPEDHFAALCEVMRHLIRDGSDDAAVRKQKKFFFQYLQPWYKSFCDSVIISADTNFYKHAARLAGAFLDVESKSFELDQ